MTSDIPTEADTRATESPGDPATRRKPGRRRATRPTAAPVTPGEAAPAGAGLGDIVLPERASGPTTSPASAVDAPRSLDDIVLPAGPAEAAPEKPAEAEKPARAARSRSRAGTRSAAGKTTETSDETSDETSTEKSTEKSAAKTTGKTTGKTTAKSATRSTGKTTKRAAGSSAAQDGAAAEPAATSDEPGAAAEAPAKKTRARRSTKAASGAEEAPAASSGTSSGSARTKAATTGRKTTAKRGSKAATQDVSTTPDATASDDTTADATAPETTSGAATAGTVADAPGQGQAGTSASKSGSAAGGARGAGSASSQTGGRGTSTPRLATTAMLFQAPDLSTARRPRRAQAPAGPPHPHAVPETTAAAPESTPSTEATPSTEGTQAPASGPASTPEPAAEGTRRNARSGRKRATRGTGAPADQAPAAQPAAAQDAADEPRAQAPQGAAPSTEQAAPAEPAVDLSEDDVAAVQEVGVIESELLAEGVALVDLGPEDLLEDDGDEQDIRPRRRRRRGGRGRRGGRRDDETTAEGEEQVGEADSEQPAEGADRPADAPSEDGEAAEEGEQSSGRRRRRRRRGTRADRAERAEARGRDRDEVTALKGSTRLEAKKQRRREGRDAGRRRQIITEAEFLARRESVERSMVVREEDGRTQIAVLEDDVLTEHYVSQQSQASMVGNVYLGRVQNVLPSMEAAFVDVGKGRNAVLYAGEVNWDAAGIEGQPRRIEEALKSGDSVLVQVTKDPIGHKGARLTSQVTLAGRYLVFVPGGGMTGISRKLPDTERSRLKKILREVVPDGAGVIVRTAAEGASEAELKADVERLQGQWEAITAKAEKSSTSAPALLQGEPDMAIRVVRDIFNDDFSSLVVQGDGAWDEISTYVSELAPDLRERVSKWTESTDVFAVHRVDEQLAKGMDRKVWLPSGGSLVIDRTEAMTVIDVNTGKFTGAGGTLEETVTRNNLEAAEEIVRQLRLRDIGGIIVIDFIDMVLESNRDLVLRRLVECLGRDRTKHQVAEVTSLGLVQMTRKRVGQGLVEAFSTTCEHCKGRGFIVHDHPNEKGGPASSGDGDGGKKSRRKRSGKQQAAETAEAHADVPKLPDDKSEAREAVKATLATIAAAAAHAHEHADEDEHPAPSGD
ncbi:Rne/Rng family ribonuclease [Isoptericola sp. BMS4]|uniref:Rne/Rng family ribonuclease n=1 Tax=Isoptericola sp. BMS4 TaxID=2527875 RepID=UPI001F1164E6|nr:Rne/Rng family ribonuclease [Isoptericola sp. BMS4]